MDNLGFNQPQNPPNSNNTRKLARSVSVITPETQETLPLYTKTSSLSRWRPALEPLDDYTEYMECGPSPPAEQPPNIYESFEEFTTSELTIQICHDTIKSNIIEHLRSIGGAGRSGILEDIEAGKMLSVAFEVWVATQPKQELNVLLLWCAFVKRPDLLKILVENGGNVGYYEPGQGLSALHLSAFSGCVTSVELLIKNGAEVNLCPKCYTPLHCSAFGDSLETAQVLLQNGAVLETKCHESIVQSAIRANAVSCLQLFMNYGVKVESAIHLACELGQVQCLKVMVDGAKPHLPSLLNLKTKEKEQTALHLACEAGYMECVELLLDNGADPRLVNRRGQSPLHLAARAQSLECVEVLLRKTQDLVNLGDADLRTALHSAVCKNAKSNDIIEVLIQWGADVNSRDIYGYSPLHIAALNELSQCVELLIFHGADITSKSKFGMSALGIITRKTPASLAMVTQKLDSAITLHNHPESSNREVELRLDFRHILQHCHPREICFLNTFVDEGQKEILLHPLSSAFLHLKWEKIRKYYIARILFSFVFVFCLSLYVLTALAHNCYNHGKQMNGTEKEYELCEKKSMMGMMLRNNPFAIEMQWFVLVGITCCEIIRKLYGLASYPNLRQYLSQRENIIEWSVITSVFVISFIYTGRTYMWQNHVGAFAVLFGWTNLMLMIGQLPLFGSYVAMYTKVQGEFAKLLLAYSCLLIGFTISFCVIFPDSSTFANPFIGLITVLVMMTGELNLDLLVDDDPIDPPFLLEISAQVTYILFLLFVTVVLMNLLVGIAVHDIQGLQKTAGLSKLVRQTKLISYMELALFNGYLPKYLLNLLHWTALVSPKAYRVVLNVKPLNPREKRLPKDILKSAYEIAKKRKHYGHTISSQCSNATSYATTKVNKKWLNNNAAAAAPTAPDDLMNYVQTTNEHVRVLQDEIRDLKLLVGQLYEKTCNK